MPTGIEETIAALIAAAAAAAAASPFTGSPNANLVMQPAIQAGASAADQCLPSPEGYEGEPEQALDPKAADSGNSTAPVTGDHPAASPGSRKPVIELEITIYGHPPAADSPDQSLEPEDGQSLPPANLDTAQRGGPETDNTAPPSVPATTPAPTSWVPAADYADVWQQVAPAFPPDVGGPALGITGEQFNAAAKKKVADFLNDYVSDMSRDDPEGRYADPVFDATVSKTAADLVIDVASIVIDPPFFIRGVMHMGTGSAQGVTDIEQGHEVQGVVKIIGEGSSAVLLVVAPLEAGPRTAEMTMYGPERLVEPYAPAHTVLKVESESRSMASHAVREDGVDGSPVAQALEYDLEKISENVSGYEPVTRKITESRATDVFAEMDRAHAGTFNGVPGGIGRYGVFYEHCSTYGATLSTTGGIPILGVLGPRATLLWFRYAPQLGNPTIPLITGSVGASESAKNGAP